MDENIEKKINITRASLIAKANEFVEKEILIHDTSRIDIRGILYCGKNVEIDINVIIEGEVEIGDGVKIGSGCILKNCKVGNNVSIHPYSIIEDSTIGDQSFIGPYSRLRPQTLIGENVQIGNYVEIKNSQIDSGCRINHHSFIGDSDIEKNVTLGAGTITCNHDGQKINRLRIKEGAYIGSGSNLVAPITINSKSTIGSGSTITEDVSTGSLVIARSRQIEIENWQGPKPKNYRLNSTDK